MTRMKTKAIVIDTNDLRDKLKGSGAEIREQVALIAQESLQAQIDAINAAATMRRQLLKSAGVKVSSGTTDLPLAGATAEVAIRRSGAGTRGGRMIAFVKDDKDLFNILDAGTRNRRARGTFVFPVYEGNMIPTGDGSVGDPDQVSGAIKRGNVRIKTKKNGKPQMAVKRKGQIVKGFKGKGLYQAAADYAESMISSLKIKIDGKHSVKLKKGDVQISVPDRPRFG